VSGEGVGEAYARREAHGIASPAQLRTTIPPPCRRAKVWFQLKS
jgi:hypothetical protein